MNTLLTFLLVMFMFHPITIFDFEKDNLLTNWRSVDDVVMGGRSSGALTMNDDGHGVFHGNVSLDNNGGFSMIQYSFTTKSVEGFTVAKIRLKGDGKQYQFRIKAKLDDYYSYNYSFPTSGEWETITIPLNGMAPAFRGRLLNIPNFDQPQIEQIALLIGNKKPQEFALLIDKIELE